MSLLGKKFKNKASNESVIVTFEDAENIAHGKGVLMPIHQFLKFYEEIDESETAKSELSELEEKYEIRLNGFPREMFVHDGDEKTGIIGLVLGNYLNEYMVFDADFGVIIYSFAKDI